MRKHDWKMPGDSRLRQTGLIVVCIMVILAVILVTGHGVATARSRITVLHDGWSASFRGQQTRNVPTDELSFPDIRDGESAELSVVLPDSEIRAACVQIRSDHASIRAWVGDKEVYSWGESYKENGYMTPGNEHYIPLPDYYALQELRIVLTACEDGAFSRVNTVLLGNIDDVYSYRLQSGRATLAVGSFLVTLFVALFFVYLYLLLFVRRESRILLSGLISLELGAYMLSYYEILPMFHDSAGMNAATEYGVLFLLPGTVCMFIASIRQGIVRRVCMVMAVLDCALALLVLVLHLSHLVYPSKMLIVVHVLMLVETFVILFAAAYHHRKTRDRAQEERWNTSDKVLLLGLGIMMLLVGIEIVRYTISHSIGEADDSAVSINFITIGALVFALSLLLNAFYYNLEYRTAEQTRQALEGLAFTDPLTELANRGRCEQMLREIGAEDEPYTLISMDVDDLKLTNDRYSHAEGDRMLIGFSRILTEVFADARLIGRMGGDEFIVILPDTSQVRCRECLQQLEQRMQEENKENNTFLFGASYGTAFSHERAPHAIDAVLALADERMYRMKQLRHKERRVYA